MWSDDKKGRKSWVEALLLSQFSHVAADDFAGPLRVAEAYDVQRDVFSQLGQPIALWKIALTSAGPREELGAAEPTIGRLSAAQIFRNGDGIRIVADEIYAEAELIFELGQDLPPRAAPYSEEEVSRAIGAMYVGIELAASRFAITDLNLGQLIADNAMGAAILIGEHIADCWDASFADLAMHLDNGDGEAAEGSTNRVMGSPLTALTWAANWLSANEQGLSAGQFVASGNCTGLKLVTADQHITVRCADIGQAHTHLIK